MRPKAVETAIEQKKMSGTENQLNGCMPTAKTSARTKPVRTKYLLLNRFSRRSTIKSGKPNRMTAIYPTPVPIMATAKNTDR